MELNRGAIVLWTIIIVLFGGVFSAALNSVNNNILKREGQAENVLKFQTEDLLETRRCGYEGCPKPKPNMINVHIVPHTHDDVGWLKTVDQYFYGSRNNIQKAGVQYILDSVVQELLRDPNKRFIYVESAFFFKWWNEQTDSLKEQVKQLVNEGRLEFIGGSWSMNDEATTNYQSIVDQFTWGLRRLNDTFGQCGRPKVGWQIDPFGHSREMASLFAQMGYDGLLFGRLDYQDKAHRLTNRNAEMIWHGSANLGEQADLFTGAMFNTYSPPPGFCFDILCQDEPIIDDKRSSEYNVDRRVQEFFNYVNLLTTKYRSGNIIITMGEDFHYQSADSWYKNLDKLILHANERQEKGSDINLFYSTPSCYLKALHDSNLTWPTKSDDFFPYASDPHAFWTGYFTSRPTLKRFERVGNHFLQVCKQLSVLADTFSTRADMVQNLEELREVMGIMQHHDAVTGTEKQHVANDYARLLHNAISSCEQNTREVLNQLTIGKKKNEKLSNPDPIFEFSFSSCPDLNISSCDVSESSEKFMVTLYNPLAHSTFQYIRLPVESEDYEVKDYRNVPTAIQIVPVPRDIQSLHYRSSKAAYEIVFLATEIPPLGYKSYFVTKKPPPPQPKVPEVFMVGEQGDDPNANADSGPVTIGNKYLNLTFDENGLLSTVETNGIKTEVSQNFYYYLGAAGNNEVFVNRSSGAYIFRPNGTDSTRVAGRADIRVVRGNVVDEVHQTFNEWISQVVRVYKDENIAEFEWLVGEIPVYDQIGREVITRFDTDIKSNGVFFTDSNGREMLRRQRNHRDTWKIELEETISGNYYPVTSKIAIEDDKTRLAILNDRAQGGSSMADGSIEIMIHRRLLHDDAFGAGEALNETAFGKGLIARGVHYLTINTKKAPDQAISQATERFIQLKKLLPSWVFFSDASKFSYDTWRTTYTNIYSVLSLSLPQNVHLMTFEPWKDGTILIRFEHILEKNEDPEYSKSVTFNFNDVFRSYEVYELRETTLAANQWLSEAVRMKFKPDTEAEVKRSPTIEILNQWTQVTSPAANLIDPKPEVSSARTKRKRYRQTEVNDDDYVITLNPMQIRTFVVTLEWKPT